MKEENTSKGTGADREDYSRGRTRQNTYFVPHCSYMTGL